jgi:hypothetical protein
MGIVTQEMFYKLRARGIWFDKVDRVIREYDHEGRPIVKVCLSNADVTAWESFPGSKFNTIYERHAVLASGNGLYAVQTMRGLFGTWLGSMAYTLREVAVQPRNQNIVVFIPSHRGVKVPAIPATHWLFCITLPDGSDYAVDLANAQFAHTPTRMQFHGIMPWTDYISHLRLVEAEIIFHNPVDDSFSTQEGIYGRAAMRRGVYVFLHDGAIFDTTRRDQMTQLLTRFSLILSIENCLYQRFRKEKNDPTIFLTEILVSPAAAYLLYTRRILKYLDTFLLAWRVVLRRGKPCAEAPETPAEYLEKMWNLMQKALRDTHGVVLTGRRTSRSRLFGQARLADTP